MPFNRNHVRFLTEREAGKNSRCFASFSSQNRKLTVRGSKVDTIHSWKCKSPDPLKPDAPMLLGDYRYPRARYTGVNSDTLPEALWKTLMLDHPLRGKDVASVLEIPWECSPPTVGTYRAQGLRNSYFTEEICRAFNQFRTANKDMDIYGRPLKSFFGNVNHGSSEWLSSTSPRNLRLTVVSLVGRRLFTTVSGFIGLAPETAQSGDVIAVVLGCNFPVVLRPCGDEYRIVGECYAHGLMDGEVFDLERAGECTFGDIRIC